jgi:hypothetical protein
MPEPALILPGDKNRLVIPRAMQAPHECRDWGWRALHTRPESIISAWFLDEVAGTVAHDLSGRRHNGTYVGVDLGRQGIGDGRTSPYFDGTNDYVNIYSAALAAAFNAAEGTLLCWAKVSSAAVWTDATNRYIVMLMAVTGTDNCIYFRKAANVNQLILVYKAGGVSSSLIYSCTRLDWVCLSMTWSKATDTVRHYVDGLLRQTVSGLGTWAGALDPSFAVIGAYNTIPSGSYNGSAGSCVLWNCALSAQEVARVGTVD